MGKGDNEGTCEDGRMGKGDNEGTCEDGRRERVCACARKQKSYPDSNFSSFFLHFRHNDPHHECECEL